MSVLFEQENNLRWVCYRCSYGDFSASSFLFCLSPVVLSLFVCSLLFLLYRFTLNAVLDYFSLYSSFSQLSLFFF